MTTKNTEKYVSIEKQLYKLSNILCEKILEYKNDILKKHSIFDIM